jgi:hypothetical protein
MNPESDKEERADLVAAAGVLEEAVVEAGAMGEEVVDLAGLHVVGKAGDEEGEDALPLQARVRRRRVHVVGVPRHAGGGQAVGEAHLGAGWLGSLDLALARQHGRRDFLCSRSPLRLCYRNIPYFL